MVIARQFLTFAVVGTAAFVLDAGVLTVVTRAWGLDLYSGRAVSFVCAATFTWFMNRTLTFPQAARGRFASQWALFLGANVLGGAVNFGVYAALIATVTWAAKYPVCAVAAGSLSGLLFNFNLSRKYVFRGSH
jgi:putative flippase GtrA